MDDLDKKALSELMAHGRITWAELASRMDLSSPAAADRVRRLEDKGIIKGYHAEIDPEKVGYGLTAFIFITLERPEHTTEFLHLIKEIPEIQECHHITGEDNYLVKVRCHGTRDLDRIITTELRGMHGVVKTKTVIVLDTQKETTTVPLKSNDE
uniref:Lrp/AsnC family transcriptional regulator n=1 Tax=Brochothrix thermosphacta TaxID=2756 RepID=UPI000D11479C|nr:Lrp/AsnC family transcriptional regulator [Brochothrix thermosphacta]